MHEPHFFIALTLAGVGMAIMAQAKTLAAETILECPIVMEHTVDKTKYAGWLIYSNMPVRLTGADIQYIVDQQYEATLEPDQVNRWNDDNLSTAQVFQLTKHKDTKDLSLVCHYGVHAQLSRLIPTKIRECTIVHHGRFKETEVEGEFKVFCK